MTGERQFGPYQLVRQVAVGGMAEIHLAKTRGIAGFEKYVALKVIHNHLSEDEKFIEMLIDEAKISVHLQHVNIAQTFDLGRVGDTYYITMEYVDGADMYKLLRTASEKDIDMPIAAAAFIAKEIANGLDYAHRRRSVDGQPLGIVHRDISPQNVLVSYAGEVKLVDFGIAKATMKARQTDAGVIKGKYYYMSPEQAWGDDVDARTDIFATGILLYEALTGQMLYLEENMQRLLDMVRRANIRPPTYLRPEIPKELTRIVMRALAKQREQRYQTASDLAAELERFLHVHAPVFRPAMLSQFYDRVLGDESPPTEAKPVDDVRPPSTLTGRISSTDVMRVRDGFADENSVIFRISDLKGKVETDADKVAQSSEARDAHQPTRPIPPPVPKKIPRPDLENIEERTVISAAPMNPGSDGFEPTVVGNRFEDTHDDDLDSTTMNDDAGTGNGHLARALADHRAGRDAKQKTTPVPPIRPAAAGAQSRAGTAHPALAANTPQPAVSHLAPPRASRKTPGNGTPKASGSSVLSALVGTGDVPSVRRDPASASAREAVGADAFAALPSGAPPSSLTRQLAAIELEEIPAHLKLGNRRSGWLIPAFVAAFLVGVGIVVGMVLFSDNGGEREVALTIKTNPEGVQVRVNGELLPGVTPLRWTGAEMDKSYELQFELEGYERRKKKVLIDVIEDEVMIFLERYIDTVTLVVETQPSGAEIFLNSQSYGHAPKRFQSLIPAKAVTLELRKRGYKTHRESLDWSKTTEIQRNIELREK